MSRSYATTKYAASGGSGTVLGLTDSGDHKNFTIGGTTTSTAYILLMNNYSYATSDSQWGFGVSGSTLTLNKTQTKDLQGVQMFLLCI